MRFALVLMCGLFVATGSSANSAPAPEAPPPKEVVKCRSEAETGSRIRAKRTCRTQAEWVAIDKANQGLLQSAQQKNSAWTGGNPQ
jgi:hypothetical protein